MPLPLSPLLDRNCGVHWRWRKNRHPFTPSDPWRLFVGREHPGGIPWGTLEVARAELFDDISTCFGDRPCPTSTSPEKVLWGLASMCALLQWREDTAHRRLRCARADSSFPEARIPGCSRDLYSDELATIGPAKGLCAPTETSGGFIVTPWSGSPASPTARTSSSEVSAGDHEITLQLRVVTTTQRWRLSETRKSRRDSRPSFRASNRSGMVSTTT